MRIALLLALAAAAPAALAHPADAAAGALHGFMHPFSGADHLLAMLAVGLWASRYAGWRRWALPAAFVCFMALGAVLPLRAAEPAIALSVLVIGLGAALALRVPLAAGAGLIAFFALHHGQIHLAEMPAGVAPAGFAAGMLAASALLHGSGVLLAVLSQRARPWLPRALGAALGAAGALLLAV